MERILYYGMSDNMGGIEAFVMNVYRNIDHEKIQIDFLKLTDTICFEKELLASGSRLYPIQNRKKHPISYLVGLVRFFRQHPEYRVIHMNLNNCSCIGPAVMAHFFGLRVISHSHNDWRGKKKISILLNALNKKILPKVTDVFLACSQAAGTCVFPHHNFSVIPNAIDANKYLFNEEVRNQYRKQLNIQGKFVIGHVGRFHPQKNHKFLLDIFKAIHDRNNDAILLLVGDGTFRPQIEEKIAELNLQNCVIILGVRFDIPELMQAMDVFVFPSLYEGLGIVAIEAQAAGLSCIVSDAIPQEAFITDLIQSVPLSVSPQVWADKILQFKDGCKRGNTVAQIQKAGLDIRTSVKTLENLYFRK